MDKYAVIGAGNAGYALAAHLKQLGCTVSLYDIASEQLASLQESNNVITLKGNINVAGDAQIDIVTQNLKEAVEDSKVIICVTPAHTHKFVAKDLAPLLTEDQMVMLHPGRTCGALEVRKVLKEQGCRYDSLVVEAQTLLYACRKDKSVVEVFGVKEKVFCAGLPKEKQNQFFDIMKPLLPQFVPADGIWNTSLENIGMLFHPTPTLLNIGRMESPQRFEYYHDGISPSIAFVIEKIDAERLNVGQVLGVKLPTALEWLKRSYGAAGKNLYEGLQNNKTYAGIMAPHFDSIDDKKGIRYVIEDVPTGLVPVSELAKKFGVETPVMNLMIDLANVMFETDFRAKGRNLKQIGLNELTPDEIRRIG